MANDRLVVVYDRDGRWFVREIEEFKQKFAEFNEGGSP